MPLYMFGLCFSSSFFYILFSFLLLKINFFSHILHPDHGLPSVYSQILPISYPILIHPVSASLEYKQGARQWWHTP